MSRTRITATTSTSTDTLLQLKYCSRVEGHNKGGGIRAGGRNIHLPSLEPPSSSKDEKQISSGEQYHKQVQKFWMQAQRSRGTRPLDQNGVTTSDLVQHHSLRYTPEADFASGESNLDTLLYSSSFKAQASKTDQTIELLKRFNVAVNTGQRESQMSNNSMTYSQNNNDKTLSEKKFVSKTGVQSKEVSDNGAHKTSGAVTTLCNTGRRLKDNAAGSLKLGVASESTLSYERETKLSKGGSKFRKINVKVVGDYVLPTAASQSRSQSRRKFALPFMKKIRIQKKNQDIDHTLRTPPSSKESKSVVGAAQYDSVVKIYIPMDHRGPITSTREDQDSHGAVSVHKKISQVRKTQIASKLSQLQNKNKYNSHRALQVLENSDVKLGLPIPQTSSQSPKARWKTRNGGTKTVVAMSDVDLHSPDKNDVSLLQQAGAGDEDHRNSAINHYKKSFKHQTQLLQKRKDEIKEYNNKRVLPQSIREKSKFVNYVESMTSAIPTVVHSRFVPRAISLRGGNPFHDNRLATEPNQSSPPPNKKHRISLPKTDLNQPMAVLEMATQLDLRQPLQRKLPQKPKISRNQQAKKALTELSNNRVLTRSPEKLVNKTSLESKNYHVFPVDVRDRAYASSISAGLSPPGSAEREKSGLNNQALLAVQNSYKSFRAIERFQRL